MSSAKHMHPNELTDPKQTSAESATQEYYFHSVEMERMHEYD